MKELPSQFTDLVFTEPHYPGSKTKRKVHDRPTPAPKAPTASWDSRPKVLLVKGQPVEFFTAGALAKALNRKIVTIRQWELRGVIPLARFRSQSGRRMYPRSVIEGMVVLAKKHGIWEFNYRPQRMPPEFTEDVIALWKEPVP